MRRLYRAVVPSSIRQRVRKTMREVPIRFRDLPADLKDRVTQRSASLPPARLRGGVGLTSSREHFLDVGRRTAQDLLAVFPKANLWVSDYPRWLDFGAGCGRVARHLALQPAIRRLTGIDVDARAIRWAAAHLRNEYRVIAPMPPTIFADGSFDVAYAVSVFTHLDELQQNAWLAELHRLLRPGGLLLASTHGAHLVYNRPDLTVGEHEQLRDHGFTFRRGIGPFNEDSAFHTRVYLEREWTRHFELVLFEPEGLAGYLDLSLWRKRSD